MKPVKVIESPSFNNFIENISDYAELFMKERVLVLRNANFTENEQKIAMNALGDVLQWYPNSKDSTQRRYKENHERVVSVDKKTKDDIIVSWHLEHTEYDNPIVAATWNMYLFTCEKDVGRTFFVDASKMYKDMPKEWQDFLLKAKEHITKDESSYVLKCVRPHFYTKELVIRMDLTDQGDSNYLELFDDREPTDEEKAKYKEIRRFFMHQILSNEDIRMYHEWEQGDFLLVDLFKMAHSVAGGFTSDQRSFTGYWSHQYEMEQ
jgi:alpha-ketoglutarate-dependent taurine dioxygenase